MATNAIWDLAKSTKEVTVGGKKVKIEDAVEELLVNLRKFQKENKDEYNRTATKLEKLKVGLLGSKNMFRRLNPWTSVMDAGDIKGPFRKYIYQETSDGYDTYQLKKIEFLKNYKKLVTDLYVMGSDPILATELVGLNGKAFQFRNKQELMGALLHTGNDSSLKKLLVGREWGMLDENGELVRHKWDAFIKRMQDTGVLTKKDYDFIQGVWDMMEELKPDAQKAHKKIYGFFFDEVTSKSFSTPFGEYRGGYAPAKIDSNEVKDIARKDELEKFLKGHSSFTWPGAGGNGFTKGRNENFSKALMLDLGIFERHMDEVLRFVYVKPAVIDAVKIITNTAFREEMDLVDPTVIDGLIKPALNRTDKNQMMIVEGPGATLMHKAGKWARQRASMQIFFGNIKNTLEQITGFSVAAVDVKPKNLLGGLYRFATSPRETAKAVTDSSNYMKVRLEGQVFDLEIQMKGILDDRTKYDDAKDFAKKHAFFSQTYMQHAIDVAVWSGAYDQSIGKGMSHDLAVKFSDNVVQTTQDASRPIDVSKLETLPLLSFVQMFMGYFNMLGNKGVTEMHNIIRADLGIADKSRKLTYVYMMVFAIPAIAADAIGRAISGEGLDEDDDGEITEEMFDLLVGSQVRLLGAMVPIAGAAVTIGLNGLDDKPYNDRISASPAISGVAAISRSIVNIPKNLSEGEFKKKDIREGLTAVGILTGLPIGPLSKPISYSIDLKSGDANPTGPIDAARGFISGRPGK